ncbi:MAG: hypothetical protein QHC79_25495 [Pseudosphingobacterium sp.]|nr:hypothetical protein [Pseudosphingobacterium sp.]
MNKNKDQGDKTPRKKNDELLKGAFEEWFPEFLRFLYPAADDLFDFEKGLTFKDKELLAIIPDRERRTGKRVADLLVKVFLKDGSEKYILLNTEIEGGDDTEFAERIYEYNYRIWDRYRIPVATIAVFTGSPNQPRPDAYQRQILDTTISFRYRAYHIYGHTEKELLAMDNAFALIVLACQKASQEGKVPEEELGEDRSAIARTMIASGRYGRDRIIAFLMFLKNFIYIKNDKINRKFDSYIYEVTGGTIDMGIIETIRRQDRQQGREEGKIEGKIEGKQEVVSNLLLATKFSISEIANLANVEESFVRKVKADLAKKKN